MRVVFFTLRLLCLACGLVACNLDDVAPRTTIAPSPTYQDAADLMTGVCFEAALQLSNITYTLQDPDELTRFYDRIDSLEVCRRPIFRADFPANGGVVIGRWDAGRGCTAQHEVITQDGVRLALQFTTSGDCPYELIRPFWILTESVQAIDVTTP